MEESFEPQVRRLTTTSNTKEVAGSLRRFVCEHLQGHAAGGGDGFGGISDEGWLAALAAFGLRGEVGRVSFQHETSGGGIHGALEDFGGLGVGGDAGEGDDVALFQQGLGLRPGIDEAVKLGAESAIEF